MNQEDCDRLADRLIRAAELIRTRGVKALTVSAAWRGNLRAANYDPDTGGGLRHDIYEENGVEHVVAVPHDPTGEAASAQQQEDQLRHARIVAAIGRADMDCSTLTALIVNTVPHAPKKQEDGPPEGACENCWLDARYFQPVEHYKKLCRWCGDFKATEGQPPPLKLVRWRHAGRRITRLDIHRALGRKDKSA